MKAYVITTGAVFGLITLAHVARVVAEPKMAKEPFFILLTLLAAGLCVWALRVLLRMPRS